MLFMSTNMTGQAKTAWSYCSVLFARKTGKIEAA